MFIALALYTSWVKAMLQCLAWMSPMKHNCYFLYDRCTCSGCPSLLSFITVVIQAHASWLLALFPSILLKNGGRREPGNICGKRCWLPAPGSGSTTQIAEQNHKYTWHFVHSAKNCQLENQLISTDWTSKVGEKQFWMYRRDASPDSLRSKFTVVGFRDRHAHHTSQFQIYM